MRFPRPLGCGVLLKRYKRFLADVRILDGSETMAPGGTLGLAKPGAEIWLLASADTKRKLAWSWGLTTGILDKDEPMRSANRTP